ncbi:hypothetical protein SH1V18_21450 [Vallitalea longa]|uniref:Flavodoxin-like domain-containing protein n=1 Tax=Vallitalea longa TaxID=2936439 RepID=A0A9W5Y9C9_9FIRM|nr:flavodoxin domain-containing protein [Vallitalea longa]GKX29665.1 hypothetical protein SH1V18_21450 [Vallitalea longa]
MDTNIIYESKYGTTKEIAKNLAMILGPARYGTTDEWKNEYENSEYIIIGTPIYGEKINPKINDFINNNIHWLRKKKVFLFCVNLMQKGGERYLEPLKNILGNCVASTKALGGKLVLDDLDSEDYSKMKNFTKAYGVPFQDVDLYNINQITEYGLSIRKHRDYNIKMPIKTLKAYVEKFLKEHNNCTLSTGYDNMVRSTPVEYTYDDGYMYILSEGGFKFANLLLNDNVSVAIYEQFHGMNTILGMQITGKARIIEDGSQEYNSYLDKRKIKEDKLPSPLHLIKIKVESAEILSYELNEMGYGIKHYYKAN